MRTNKSKLRVAIDGVFLGFILLGIAGSFTACRIARAVQEVIP